MLLIHSQQIVVRSCRHDLSLDPITPLPMLLSLLEHVISQWLAAGRVSSPDHLPVSLGKSSSKVGLVEIQKVGSNLFDHTRLTVGFKESVHELML